MTNDKESKEESTSSSKNATSSDSSSYNKSSSTVNNKDSPSNSPPSINDDENIDDQLKHRNNSRRTEHEDNGHRISSIINQDDEDTNEDIDEDDDDRHQLDDDSDSNSSSSQNCPEVNDSTIKTSIEDSDDSNSGGASMNAHHHNQQTMMMFDDDDDDEDIDDDDDLDEDSCESDDQLNNQQQQRPPNSSSTSSHRSTDDLSEQQQYDSSNQMAIVASGSSNNSNDDKVVNQDGPSTVVVSNNDNSEKKDDSAMNSTHTNDSKTEEESSDQTCSTPTSSSSSTSSTTTSTSLPAVTDTRRRVKLYMLNANRTWDDRGTGHVSSSYIDRLNGMSLLVKAETDGSTLLESKIMADTAYQKQQDTLIVWSEGENYDLALSFQERVGCEEIWAKICQVQGKDPSVDITQDFIEDEDNELPPVEIQRLDEINSILTSSLQSPPKKENITLALENDHYILKLLELFRQCENRQDIPALQKIYEIFKNIFLLNKNSLIDIMLSDNAICDVIGVFEYDPNGARVREATAKNQHKSLSSSDSSDGSSTKQKQMQTSMSSSSSPLHRIASSLSSQSQSYFTSLPSSSETELMRLVREKRHREFLQNVSRFKEVIPLSKSELVAKIHQTYRVQYIQDVIMPTPSVFEENMLSALSSVLFFNKIEIVTLIQEDDKFLKELFRQLSDDTPSFNEKRRDLVLFLKELCAFSHTLQNRESFIKTLSQLGLLQTIETLLVCDDCAIKLGAVDLLTYVVDYSPSMVREYALQQEINTDKPTEQYIINIIIEQMICDIDPDLGMAQQLSGILKMIIDPDNMLTQPGISKTEKSEFLNYFYKHCIYYLTAPILAATEVTTKSQQPNAPIVPHQAPTTLAQPTSQQQLPLSMSGTAVVPGPPPPPPTSSSLPLGPSAVTVSNVANPLGSSSTTAVVGVQEDTSEPLAFENSCQAAQLLAIILELLTFCIEHHAYHIRTYLLQKEIVRRIMMLTRSRHTFLVLTVIRFMRKLVGLKDEFYNRHIVTMNLFQPIIDAFLMNKGRYNLLDSAVIDLFEFIDHNEILTLLNYTVEKFWRSKLERIDYVRTFKSLKRHYSAPNSLIFGQRNRYRRDPRQVDKEEDMWFNDDDDEDECADDDDDDDDNGGYHEDDDDGTGSPPSPVSSALQPSSTSTASGGGSGASGASIESRLSLSDPIDYAAAHHHYGGSLSQHGGKPISSGGSSGIGHHHHHPLHMSGSTGNQNSTTSSSGSSSYNSLTAATNSLYESGAGQANSAAVAFVDSPFFSTLASVAAAGGAGNAASGHHHQTTGMGNTGMGSMLGNKKKQNERKLTINLNHKTASFLSGGNNPGNSPNPMHHQQNPLSALTSSGLVCGSLSSINSSIAAVAAAAAAAGCQSGTGAGSSPNSGGSPSSFQRSSSSNPNSPLIGCGAPTTIVGTFHMAGAKASDSSTAVLSRKALVDYPDEDSDEDELEDDLEEEPLDDDDDDLLNDEDLSNNRRGKSSLSTAITTNQELTTKETTKSDHRFQDEDTRNTIQKTTNSQESSSKKNRSNERDDEDDDEEEEDDVDDDDGDEEYENRNRTEISTTTPNSHHQKSKLDQHSHRQRKDDTISRNKNVTTTTKHRVRQIFSSKSSSKNNYPVNTTSMMNCITNEPKMAKNRNDDQNHNQVSSSSSTTAVTGNQRKRKAQRSDDEEEEESKIKLMETSVGDLVDDDDDDNSSGSSGSSSSSESSGSSSSNSSSTSATSASSSSSSTYSESTSSNTTTTMTNNDNSTSGETSTFSTIMKSKTSTSVGCSTSTTTVTKRFRYSFVESDNNIENSSKDGTSGTNSGANKTTTAAASDGQ